MGRLLLLTLNDDDYFQLYSHIHKLFPFRKWSLQKRIWELKKKFHFRPCFWYLLLGQEDGGVFWSLGRWPLDCQNKYLVNIWNSQLVKAFPYTSLHNSMEGVRKESIYFNLYFCQHLLTWHCWAAAWTPSRGGRWWGRTRGRWCPPRSCQPSASSHPGAGSWSNEDLYSWGQDTCRQYQDTPVVSCHQV